MPGFDDRNVIGLIQSAAEERFEMNWATGLSLYNGNSDRAAEQYGIFGGFAKMREWLGARQGNQVAQKQYEIRNRKYESTLVVKNDDLNRDKSGLLQAHIGDWVDGTIMYQWEDLVTDLINANSACYDTKNFFATDHQFEAETAQKNLLSSTEVAALDVATATAPTPTEMAAAILGITGHMLTFKDNKDRFVNGGARKFTVAVATVNLFSAAVQAISGNLLTGNVDNPLTGMKMGGFSYEVKMIPALTSATDKVFVFRNDGSLKPFLLQEEVGIQYKRLGEGSDFEFENDAIKIGVNTNRGAGYGQWMHAARGTLV